ncbi:MAG: GGDEF domain-containing protein, partial [Actinobacteria bacterium]|nr:GGDEF domain-containing protein [Actinomycetota bacterium]
TLYSHDTSLGTGAAATATALASLPTRSTFDNLVDAALRRAQRNAVPVGVMACGLDGFDEVVATLGREASETLVAATAARLAHALRGEDLLMHDGAGQFLVVADSVANDEVATQVGRRLRAAVSEPIVLHGTEVRSGLSIGYTLGFGGERTSDLWEHAERALIYARSVGGDTTASVGDADAASQTVEASAIDWNELAGSDTA